ncbi:MAG: DsbE family thiol:disulfide interchange protein [Pseudomonadales bacterium]
MTNKALLIPLGIFVALVIILAIGFKLEDPHLLPSALIERPFPEFSLRELGKSDSVITKAELTGSVSLVNVWATWCPNCVVEHPELMRISKEEGIPIYGINYNDEDAKAIRWLERYKNPYERVIVDNEGRLGIDLGVYGAPETFIVDQNGVIQHRHVGTLTRKIFQDEFVPVIRHLEQKVAMTDAADDTVDGGDS